MTLYRAFGFAYSAYIEVKVPEGTPQKAQEPTAKAILDETAHKLFGSYALGNGVTVILCGIDRSSNNYVVFEEKKEENLKHPATN